MKTLVLTVFLICAVVCKTLPDHAEKFKVFKLNYGKIYKNRYEETRRFNIFKNNLQIIDQHNSLYVKGLVSYKQGVNKFTDMTQEEFQSMLTLSSLNRPNFNSTTHTRTGIAAPDSVDWRAMGQVTEVKDQGFCGSCWAFSLVGSIEAANYRKSGKLVSLSEQQLVDCTLGSPNNGCLGGFLEATFPYIEECGLESEDTYPYTALWFSSCKYSAVNVVTKVSSHKVIDTNDEDALLDVVANIGPVSVALNATNLASYKSGIYDIDECSPEKLNHGVVIVGFGTENGIAYWIVKNSWGPTWGENGYFRIKRGCNKCGIAKDTVYPICS